MSNYGNECVQLWQRLQERKPLVQCITNFVSMDLMANSLNAVGASPAMVHGIDEVEDFARIASAVLINVGTLDRDWVESMVRAAESANSAGKPWILDPVGVGATPYRTQMTVKLLNMRPTLVRGNASEILALTGAAEGTRGVDSTADSFEALSAGQKLAKQFGTVVAISGKEDYITAGTEFLRVRNGVEMMTRITAAGCSVTAVAAAFVSMVDWRDKSKVMEAASFALGIFGLAAQKAEKDACGPGSLRTCLLDQLYILSSQAETLKKQLCIDLCLAGTPMEQATSL